MVSRRGSREREKRTKTRSSVVLMPRAGREVLRGEVKLTVQKRRGG